MKYTKVCKCCGKEFETNSPQKLFCDREHYLPCPICGTPVLKKDRDFTRPPKCCSSKCTHELRKRSFKPKQCMYCGDWFVPKSGVALVCDKTHYRKCEICGKEFVRTPSTDHDNITTCSPSCTQEKMKRNSLAKYGTEHPMQSPEVQKRFHDAMKAKYGVEHALQIPGKVDQQQRQAYITNMEHWGVPYACFTPNCMTSNPNVISTGNKKFAKRLNALGIETQFEVPLGQHSFDIGLTDQNVVIEINPTYTHNSIGSHWGKGKDKEYHLRKTYIAQEAGYRCIHVFDWDNWTKVLNLFIPKTQIYARNCEIVEVPASEASEFLNLYHLQGTCRGQLLGLGLTYNDELVSLMTFGKSRYNKNYEWELLRLCTHPNYRVVGGASKLFKHAVRLKRFSSLISYCDLAKFEGNVYKQIGMRWKSTTPPQEIWSKNSQYVTANLLRSRGYDQLFGTNYGKGTSNDQLMLENGWLPVYDCGQDVYEYRSS